MTLKRSSNYGLYKRIDNKDEIIKNYHTALEYFWLGCKSTAIEHLTKVLADLPDNFLSFNFYRLWIEILLDQKDYSALRALNTHLKLRSHMDSVYSHTYLALSGLIHYELDEFKAASLIAKGISRYKDDPYCQELVYLIQQRTSSKPIRCPLITNLKKINDYYHFQTIIKYLTYYQSNNNYNKIIKTIITKLEKLFPNSPLPLLYKIHTYYAQQEYKKAKLYANKLFNLFPSQVDNAVYLGLIAIKDNDLELAKMSLEKAKTMKSEDVDVDLLLGICYSLVYQNIKDERLKKIALDLLSKTAKYLETRGLSSIIPDYYKNLLVFEDKHKMQLALENIPKIWVNKLNAREFHTIRTDKIEDIQYIYKPINKEAKVGDICILVGEDYRSNVEEKLDTKIVSFRLAAAYIVVSDVKKDCIYGPHNLLKLITRPSYAIPVEMQIMEESTSKNYKETINTFELNYEALDNLIENIRSFYREYNLKEENLLNVIESRKAS